MLDTFRDPGFIVDCEKQRLEVGNFVSGERMEKIVGRVYAMPAEIKNRLVQIYAVGRDEQARQKKKAK
jgi:hypothetical protein